jgi:hypothetical protein
MAFTGGSPVAIVVNPLNRWGWARDQATSPSHLRMIFPGNRYPPFRIMRLLLDLTRFLGVNRSPLRSKTL